MRRAQPSRVRGSAPAAGHRRLQPAGGRCLCRAPLAASSATFTLPTLPPLPAWAARARRGGGGAASTLKEGDAPALSPRPVAAVRPLSEPSDPALPPVADPPATTALSLAPPPPLPSSPSLALALVAPARAPPAAPPRPPPPSKKGGAPRSAPGRARPESLFTSLWRVARPVWPTLATALGAQLAAACVFLATPRAFGRVLDAVVVSPTGGASSLAPAFPEALLWLGSLYAGQCVAAFTQSWTLATAADTLGLRLRCAAFEAILRQDAAFFDTSATGELGSRLGADAAAVTGACAAAARGVRASVEAVGALAVLSLTSPLLTLVALSVAPVAAMLSQRLGARVKALSRSAAAAAAEAAATAEEAVANVRTLKSFVREAGACAAYAKRAQRAFRLQQRIALHAGALDGLTRAAGNAGAIAILALGGGLVAAGALTVGALTSFVIYTLYISSALGTLSACYSELKRAEGTGSRLFALLRRVPDVRAPPEALLGPPQPHRRGAMRVSLRGVSFRFPGRPNLALQCVDIELEPGQVTALVGPSGSGKSTVAALLQRFYDPESGSVLLDGIDIRDMDPAWLRAHVACVAQEPALFDASIADNIALGAPSTGRPPTRAQVVAAAMAANAHEFISSFPSGYDTRLGERGVALSGGQRQRIAIARAILKDAPILVLDEATSALDMESEGAVQEALERLTRGRTTLVIAHRFAALRNAATIVVLDAGRVVESGSHAQLVEAAGLYRRMYSLGKATSLSGGPTGQVGRLATWAAGVPALLASQLAIRVGRPLEERVAEKAARDRLAAAPPAGQSAR